jgi:predicted nucleotidyltransferase
MTTQLEIRLIRICRDYGILGLYLFGSRGKEIAARVRGEPVGCGESDSDLDVGVHPDPDTHLSAIDKVQLAQALEDLFAVPRVDLVVLLEADPFLAANIIRGERVYAKDDYQADEYDLYILRRAGDLAPLERERIALILGETG